MIHPVFLYAAVAVACISVIAAFFMHRKLSNQKGSLAITLTKNSAKFGETISGVVTIECKKDIEIKQIVVDLSCYLRTRRGSTYSGSGSYSERKIYRSKSVVFGESIFQSGESRSLPFEICMPEAGFENVVDRNLRQHFNAKNQRNIRWDVKARVACKGVDLNAKQGLVVPWIEAAHSKAA